MTATSPHAAVRASELRVDGAAIVYRLHDVGYAIDLERASAILAPNAPERTRPARGEAQAIQIANPPVAVALGAAPVRIDGIERHAEVTARVFDFGVCALQARVDAPPGTAWEAFSRLGAAADTSADITRLLDRELAELLQRMQPAIERPGFTPVSESYVVFRVNRLLHADGTEATPSVLTDELLIPLLLNESAQLSTAARRELLPNRFSYYEDDLTVLTWDNALVVEPRTHDRDVEYVLEFANAQLLELRFYDALLDAELPRMYDRVAAARKRRHPILTWRYRGLLGALQTQLADVTETVERAENSLKVTDDVYLARIYAAAVEIFRASSWRRGIERKLSIVRQTYEMLNDEAQAARVELLELTIVVLIVADIVLGLVGV
jgi:hypothetical protein